MIRLDERIAGDDPFTSELLACGELDASELAASPVTLDAICSTHRVWLGTGVNQNDCFEV